MSFYVAGTNVSKYNYLHTINSAGNPDTLILDPDITYDLEVHTIPPVRKKNIKIIRGKHNVIPLDAPQGYMKFVQKGKEVNDYPLVVVRKTGDMNTLVAKEFGTTEKLIVGKYDVEILTLPRIKMNGIEIKQSQTETIEIPTSGLLVTNTLGKGYGSIYSDDGKNVEWVYNLNSHLNHEMIYLQPGKYKVVFRYENALQTIRTIEKNIVITSGNKINLQLY
jgi:Ca-activated chloride channel family protein